MTALRSHYEPALKLAEHIAQVRAATEAIWGHHSNSLHNACAAVTEWIRLGVLLHDSGKASAAFQQYIRAPSRYRGRKLAKSHTPLSFLLAVHHGAAHGWDWKQRLAVAVLAGCHHSTFKTADINGLEGIVANTEIADILVDQLASLDWEKLDTALGVSVPRLAADLCACDDALAIISEELVPRLNSESLADAVAYRLRCQLAFSVLLEADKACLAIESEFLSRYFLPSARELPQQLVDCHLATKPSTAMDALRRRARDEMARGMTAAAGVRLYTMTLPTGTGKTMLGATWALRLRCQLAEAGAAPKIIIVLPYLSIIDQTQDEYRQLFRDCFEGGMLISYHSLSDRVFDPESGMDGDSNDFFLDTWQSDVVITTFDQLLSALMAPESRHQMRFHNLADALIVMDEVQSLPCRLWNPLATLLAALTELGNTRLLAMSATQPGFLNPGGCRELIEDPRDIFSKCRRYRLRLRHHQALGLQDFLTEIAERSQQWGGRRVLIVLNTRRSAARVREVFEDLGITALHFLTADVTPRDRLASIDAIKRGEPCVVVATQCIEAGVDIDMDLVLRDFAPLDSLIQVAGRCNRHALRARDFVEVLSLVDDRGNPYAEMIYDKVLLQATRKILGEAEGIDEELVYDLTRAWFDELRREKDLGERVTKAWAYWRETDPVRELLRGRQARQESFVVVEQDPQLRTDLVGVASITDRWERRRAHRALAARVARVTVSVYARSGFDASRYADRDATDCHWLLRPGLYKPGRGLELPNKDEESSWGQIL